MDKPLRGARLDGSYPNTEIIVNYLDLNTGNGFFGGFLPLGLDILFVWAIWSERRRRSKTMIGQPRHLTVCATLNTRPGEGGLLHLTGKRHDVTTLTQPASLPALSRTRAYRCCP
jgi:hypothetical protein